MQRTIWMLTMLILAGGMAGAVEPKLNAIIITGADPAHQWKSNAETAREILTATGKFDATIVTNYQILDSAVELGKFNVIVLIGAFQEKKGFTISEVAQKNLLDFVNNGKGFYAQHLASSSWQEWGEFSKLCGRRWINGKSGHPKREPFEVKIINPEHPITKGVPSFTADDECYGGFGTFRDVTILATGHSPATSTDHVPLIMVSEYGKGRVVINNLGHDRKSQAGPEFRTIVARSVEWAATGKVKP